MAMYAAFLPIQLVYTDSTFCSKHVTCALQAANITAVEGLNPALMTPSMLYRKLKHAAILQIVPSRMIFPTKQGGTFFNNSSNSNNNSYQIFCYKEKPNVVANSQVYSFLLR